MNGINNALGNPKGIVQHLRHRCQAIGGAGSIRNNLMFGQETIIVNTEDDRVINVIGSGYGQYNALGTCREMGLELFSVPENSSGFDDDIDGQFSPRERQR